MLLPSPVERPHLQVQSASLHSKRGGRSLQDTGLWVILKQPNHKPLTPARLAGDGNQPTKGAQWIRQTCKLLREPKSSKLVLAQHGQSGVEVALPPDAAPQSTASSITPGPQRLLSLSRARALLPSCPPHSCGGACRFWGQVHQGWSQVKTPPLL